MPKRDASPPLTETAQRPCDTSPDSALTRPDEVPIQNSDRQGEAACLAYS